LGHFLRDAKRRTVLVALLREALKWPMAEMELCRGMADTLGGFTKNRDVQQYGPDAKAYLESDVRRTVEKLRGLRENSPLRLFTREVDGHGRLPVSAARELPCYEDELFADLPGLDIGQLQPELAATINGSESVWSESQQFPQHVLQLGAELAALVSPGSMDDFHHRLELFIKLLTRWADKMRALTEKFGARLEEFERQESRAWEAVGRVSAAFEAKEKHYRSTYVELLSPETLKKRRNMLVFALLTILAAFGVLGPKVAGIELALVDHRGLTAILLGLTSWLAWEFGVHVRSDYTVSKAVEREVPREIQIVQVWIPWFVLAAAFFFGWLCLVGYVGEEAPTEGQRGEQTTPDEVGTSEKTQHLAPPMQAEEKQDGMDREELMGSTLRIPRCHGAEVRQVSQMARQTRFAQASLWSGIQQRIAGGMAEAGPPAPHPGQLLYRLAQLSGDDGANRRRTCR